MVSAGAFWNEICADSPIPGRAEISLRITATIPGGAELGLFLDVLRDDVERHAFIDVRGKVHHQQRSIALRADLERRRGMIGKVVQTADQIAMLEVGPKFHNRLPNPGARRRNIILEL